MYSEIKSENKVLINRLDENEKILLEEIYNKSQEYDTATTFERLTDESGEFGGIFIKLEKDPNNKGIKVLGDNFPETILTKVGDESFYTIETDIPDNNYVVTFRTDEIRPTPDSKTEFIPKLIAYDRDLQSIGFIAYSPTEDTPINIYYSVNAEGYKPFNGKIAVTVEPREQTDVYFTIIDNATSEVAQDYVIQLLDTNGTEYVLNKSEEGILSTKVGLGTYNFTIVKEGYDVISSTFTVDESLLKTITSVDISVKLYPEGTTPTEEITE